MRFTATLAAAALLASSTLASAGGLSDQIVEAPVMEKEAAAPAGSSVNPTYIVLGVLAALLIAAAVNEADDDDNDDDPEPVMNGTLDPT